MFCCDVWFFVVVDRLPVYPNEETDFDSTTATAMKCGNANTLPLSKDGYNATQDVDDIHFGTNKLTTNTNYLHQSGFESETLTRGIRMNDLNQTSNSLLNNYNTSSFPNSFGADDIVNPLSTSEPMSRGGNSSNIKNALLLGNENMFANSNPNLNTTSIENENANTNGNKNSNMHLSGIIKPKKTSIEEENKDVLKDANIKKYFYLAVQPPEFK